MKTKIILSVVTLLSINMCASATLIGHDGFDTAGTIAGQTGGAGFGWDNLNDVMTTTISDWDNTGGTPSVVAGQLITHGSSAKREYNGVLEGPGTNDAPNTERAGAFRGNGTVYYSVQMTRTTGADWSGLSGYDFGSEKVFFGVPGGQGAAKVFGVQVSGGGAKSLSTMSVVEGRMYTLVTKLDFDSNLLSLWVDPIAGGEGANAPVATVAYTATNWNTAVRLGSGGSAQVAWDELRIGDTWADVAVPEPATMTLIAAGLPLLLKRKRKSRSTSGALGGLAILKRRKQ